MNTQDSIALVTGASRGIGRAIALKLGAEGMTVIGTATSEKGAENITQALAEAGIKGRGEVLDVRDSANVDALIKTINGEFGGLHVLVNNAGITKDNLLMRMKEDDWDDILNTNLTSIYRLSKACLRGMMKARYGRIINISSVVGATGNPGQTNYSAAKAGLVGFTKSLAAEVGARGITVNAIAPGFIRSDMTEDLPEEQKAALMSRIALGRLGEPEEVAGAALYLALPETSYVTGHTLHVNGGMFMQ